MVYYGFNVSAYYTGTINGEEIATRVNCIYSNGVSAIATNQ